MFIVLTLLLTSCNNVAPTAINLSEIPPQEVLILMYHDIRPEPVADNAYVVSTDTFRSHIQQLHDAGFTTISFCKLIAFVDYGYPLPSHPIVITFDDGYRSNVEIAAPILYEFGMTATINVVGVSRGSSVYRHTDIITIPHFDWDEVRPWVQNGTIHIGHHTYDMHRVHQFPNEPWRSGVLPMENETPEEHKNALIADFERLRHIIQAEIGTYVVVFAYPYGWYSTETEAILQELGVRVTLRYLPPGINTIEPGNPDSLFLMYRVNMTEEIWPQDIFELLIIER